MNIKQLRIEAGITQQALAEAIGKSRSAVALWESDRSMPKVADLPKIAKALGCEINDLYKGGTT